MARARGLRRRNFLTVDHAPPLRFGDGRSGGIDHRAKQLHRCTSDQEAAIVGVLDRRRRAGDGTSTSTCSSDARRYAARAGSERGRAAVAMDPDELTARQAEEVKSFVGALGRLNNFEELPRPFDEPPPTDEGLPGATLPTLADAFDGMTNAQHIPAPARLELLARLVQAEADRGEPLLPETSMRRWAASLVDPEAVETNAPGESTGDAADKLISMLRSAKEPRHDPLGRSVGDLGQLARPPDVVNTLLPTIQSTVLITLPRCAAATTDVGGLQALDIVTEAVSRRPLAEFRSIVDPEKWPKCWLQSSFFKSVERIAPAPPERARATSKPDDGWRATVLETVDFGLGFGRSNLISTPLDVVFFFNDPPAKGALAAVGGCTYDLVEGDPKALGGDGRIVVDSGFLLAESIDFEGETYARYRTEKRVRFATGIADPGRVCQFWSLAAGLIMQGCAHLEEQT
jgi:hypothetical protein